ncbi:MAG TPA: GPP34 family phosphoprotein [Acidimicrobiales bacterium]|nr:GPP34 family phosphoprotein [Acidimicrobiales bacterium]
MLLAEELALVALKPESGRHQIGTGEALNACLAGLLVADLLLDGSVGPGDREDRIVAVPGRGSQASPVLGAALDIVAEKGPKMKAVLSHMSRGLEKRIGMSTQESVFSGLAGAGIVGAPTGGLLTKRPVLDRAAWDAVVDRLRAAAQDDGPIDRRTALVLSMTGPAHLLEVVAPERGTRKHARNRIDHALDGSDLEPVGKVVRRLIQEAMEVAAGAAVIGGATAAGS